jgi:hypothetical protein
MTLVVEGDLQIEFPAGTIARKFDDQNLHKLSHCMKAVDFVVELGQHTLFVEFKDPDHPSAQQKSRKQFLKTLSSGKLDEELKAKCRDSFLYEWATGKETKPIHYLVLIGASALSSAELLARTDALKRKIPINGPDGKPWQRPFVVSCAVMNISAWNKSLSQFPVIRISSA